MRTTDLEESIAMVSEAFCHHRLLPARAVQMGTTLELQHAGSCPVAVLSYDAPVAIRAERPRYFVFMHCRRGTAHSRQGRSETGWRQGQTVPLAPWIETELRFDQDCVQQAVRLSPEQLEAGCTRWLGEPLASPLQFSLAPFAPAFEHTWRSAIENFWALENAQVRVTPSVRVAFEEYLVALLLHNHPHSYSAALAREPRGLAPAIVTRAERLMQERAFDATSLQDIATTLGVSLRALQCAFRRWRNTTPLAHFRTVRLQAARELLRTGAAHASVSDVALQCGFAHLGRFGAYYQAAFGESPSITLRRAKRRTTVH